MYLQLSVFENDQLTSRCLLLRRPQLDCPVATLQLDKVTGSRFDVNAACQSITRAELARELASATSDIEREAVFMHVWADARRPVAASGHADQQGHARALG